MQEIVNTLGNLVALITEFFSFIAPGYFIMILTVFLAFTTRNPKIYGLFTCF